VVNGSGQRIRKREFKQRCGICVKSKEPGWLLLGNNDWAKCPNCENGFNSGLETLIEPTRQIFLPIRTN
jgi:hypothetical protein